MSADGAANAPLGEGLRLLTIRLREEDVVLVRGMFIGYDNVASMHGDESGLLAFLATESTFAELEAFVDGLPPGLVLERVR